MAWSSETPSYCGWNELRVKNAKGKMEVHYYLERKDGCADLAVVGRLRNDKRMSFRFALKKNRSVLKKLNSREDVTNWLNSIVSGVVPNVADVQATVMTEKGAGGLNIGTFMNGQFKEPVHQTKNFSWIGSSRCTKGLKHYSSFLRNGVRISVNNFVYVLVEQNRRLIAYLDDLYEKPNGNKMVVVQWFHKTDEVGAVVSDDTSDREIFFSHLRQELNIESIDGLATVLSHQHYEKFLKMHVRGVAFVCQKLYEDDAIKPYDITQLEGYWGQEQLRYLNVSILKPGVDAQAPRTKPRLGASLVGCVGMRSRKRRRPSAVETLDVRSADDLKGDRKASPDSVLGAGVASIFKDADDGSSYLKKGSLVDVLQEDSGIRGCWFSALIIKKNKDKVKVQYQDIQDADDESKKLEEWILTSRVAGGDNLGLRIPGRTVVRPSLKPVKENDVSDVSVGMAVDVWWCDGWWEGIVVQKVSEEKFEVYLTGEKKMSTFHISDLRQSREWLEDDWVNIKARSDLVSSVLSLMKKKEMEVKLEEKPSEVGVNNAGTSPKVEAKPTISLPVARTKKPSKVGVSNAGTLPKVEAKPTISLPVARTKKPSKVGVSNAGTSPKVEAKPTISLPVARTKKSLPKRPIPDLLKDVQVSSDLKWKKSSRKRNRVVSCCPHDPSSTEGLSSERSLDCENCKFMGDSVFGSSVGRPMTGL